MALGFYFDMTRCIGCKACQVACKDKNRLGVGTTFRHAETYTVGSFPTVQAFSGSFSCNHCENPACVANCPTGAMYKDEAEGVVLHDDTVCIGCKACMNSCPYGVPQFREDLNIIQKCDSCYAIRHDGGAPACVAACPNRALDFGDMDELRAKYGDDLVSDVSVLPSSETTAPNLLIKAKPAAFEDGATELSW